MASDAAPVAAPAEAAAAPPPPDDPLPKVDPITAVQDSIDGLALSLFEALRGVRDAVAPDSLAAAGALHPAAAAAPPGPFKEEPDEVLDKGATAKEYLLNGLNPAYFPPRAFDLLEPDYNAYLLAYLGDDPYAKELAGRFAALLGKWQPEKQKLAEAPKPASPEKKEEGASPEKKESPQRPGKVELGEVGYEFRKKFDSGWFTGKVVEIKPLALNGYDRRCVYSDGDAEDLRLEDLRELARLDPNHNDSEGNRNKKPRLSIKLKVAKPDAAKETPTKDGAPSKDTPKKKDAPPKPTVPFPLSQKEYTQLLLDTEHQRDVSTAHTLARDVLAKSAAVDALVANLPGMHRTRDAQMERIQELIELNQGVARELEGAHAKARERREEVRRVLGECTCLALGVEEDA